MSCDERIAPAAKPGLITGRLLGALLLFFGSAAHAQSSLPEPLTLEAALATASNEEHFDLIAINQQIRAIDAEIGIEQANSGFSLDLEARLRRVDPSDYNLDQSETNDSAAQLFLSKPLYDFGQQDSRENLLLMRLNTLRLRKAHRIGQRRLLILERYFAVLNADNRFVAENEALATGFIRFDNAREDFELGLVSELEVLRLQSEYELVRQQYNLASQGQRLTRARLAEAMGYPDQLPSDLEIPQIDVQRPLPNDPAELWQQAMRYSQRAVLARANTQVAQSAIGMAEASDGPKIDFEIEIATYERESRLRDDARISLYFDIPLYSQTSAAKSDLARARFEQSLAEQQQIESALRLEVLELWQQLHQLKIEIEGSRVEQDYRDRYLDRSRAEYELEFKTDLGDSMVLYSRSNEIRLRNRYAFELAFRRLVDLVGQEYLDQLTAAD